MTVNPYTYLRGMKLLVCSLLLLSGCVAQQIRLSETLRPPETTSQSFVLLEPASLSAFGSRRQVLREGTTWLAVGELDRGTVFKSKDQVVTVNSYNVYEAGILVREMQVVGYYIPSTESIVEIDPVALKSSELRENTE